MQKSNISVAQYLEKNLHKDFWSNSDPGKTHKVKTNERGIFIIQSFRENIILQQSYSQQNSQTYLRNFLSKTTSEQPQTTPRFL
jgi:hypothetical protein